MMLLTGEEDCYNSLRVNRVEDIIIGVQLKPEYLFIGAGIEIAILHSDTRAGKIAETEDLISLSISIRILQAIDPFSVLQLCQFYKHDPTGRYGNMPGLPECIYQRHGAETSREFDAGIRRCSRSGRNRRGRRFVVRSGTSKQGRHTQTQKDIKTPFGDFIQFSALLFHI